MRFETNIKKFGSMGEKTGWTYIDIPQPVVNKILPGNKKIFRAKGLLDKVPFEQTAVFPMGGGNFILPLNVTMRRKLGKHLGEAVLVSITADSSPLEMPDIFETCLNDEPSARSFFDSLTRSHQHYFIKWIAGARTEATREKGVAQAINALSKKQHFGVMMRALRHNRDTLSSE